ncbi:MAG: magnesium and cobalt transport protein CorA [Propionibacteriaceae bacterium]|jgi:magnesium transporter|nr:magnesium and cobalt transport protein CorA [Propionibacteriaceae bacterium]
MRAITPKWLDLVQPTPDRIAELAAEFGLHDLLREDLVLAHQRPKLERYGDTLFAVLHTARYADAAEEVQFAEVHVLLRPDEIVTITHGDTEAVSTARRRLRGEAEIMALGPEAILYGVLDAVVDEYSPVVRGLAHDIAEIEYEVFGGDAQVSRRIWSLTGQIAAFDRAGRSLREVLGGLTAGFAKHDVAETLRSYLRDVADHLTVVTESTDHFRDRLRDILTVNAALMSQRQIEEIRELNEAGRQENEAMKKISAWAAIIFAPSLIGGIYGMNFDNMPELHWAYGYPFALGLMVAAMAALWAMFKFKRWI